jgi:hypothetical protein
MCTGRCVHEAWEMQSAWWDARATALLSCGSSGLTMGSSALRFFSHSSCFFALISSTWPAAGACEHVVARARARACVCVCVCACAHASV